MNNKIKRTVMALVAVAALGAGGAAIATAASGGGDDEADKAITGTALDSASRAALAHTGGGKVTGTEVGDEESYYEVEVTRGDGSQVDVQLDRSFNVVGADGDNDSTEDR
jgi:uncharacterized membrane protein YkoI